MGTFSSEKIFIVKLCNYIDVITIVQHGDNTDLTKCSTSRHRNRNKTISKYIAITSNDLSNTNIIETRSRCF